MQDVPQERWDAEALAFGRSNVAGPLRGARLRSRRLQRSPVNRVKQFRSPAANFDFCASSSAVRAAS